jgi:hypothetical protein
MQKRFLIAAAMMCLCLVAAASAANWVGYYDTDFMTKYNWNTGVTPTGDIATILPGVYYTNPVFNATNTQTVNYVEVLTNGLLTVSSGTLRANGADCYVTNDSLNDGLIVNGGTFSVSKNLYIGNSGTQGAVTITSGSIICSGTTTLGFRSNTIVGGLLNVWGGTVDLGNGFRISQTASDRLNNGRLNIRGSGVAFVDKGSLGSGSNDGLTLVEFNKWIAQGRITTEPGYVPVAVEFSDTNPPHSVAAPVVSIMLTAQQVNYASNPSPLNAPTGTPILPMTGQVLSWTNPLPLHAGSTVTSDVYFGTVTDVNSPAHLVASGLTANSYVVNTEPNMTYYWAITSHDPNTGGNPTTRYGKVWGFNTRNIAPVVTFPAGRRVAFSPGGLDPNAILTLTANVTDDGQPAGSTMTYLWAVVTPPSTTAKVTFVDPNTSLSPVVKFSELGEYRLQLAAKDGPGWKNGLTTTNTGLYVKVFAVGDNCNAAAYLNGFAYMAGDVNHDCVVDFRDFATVAAAWRQCNSASCP